MPESRWNDREGRFEIDRERSFDDDLGYGYDASRNREYARPYDREHGPQRGRPRHGSAELRRAVSQGGDIGYGQIRSGADYGAGASGYRAPGDWGRVGGHDYGAATGDYGGGYRGEMADYGDRAYFDHRHDHDHPRHRPEPRRDVRYYGGGPRRIDNEERTWFARTRDEVASWMGDHDALHRREADAIARGEHSGRGPKGYRRSDERIHDDVADRLTYDSWLDASNIEVTVKDGDVTLSGTVRSRDDKRRAEALAESISGVGDVQNTLRVDGVRSPATEIPRDPLG